MIKAPLPSLSDTFCSVSGAYSHTGGEEANFIQHSGTNLGRENWGWGQLSTNAPRRNFQTHEFKITFQDNFDKFRPELVRTIKFQPVQDDFILFWMFSWSDWTGSLTQASTKNKTMQTKYLIKLLEWLNDLLSHKSESKKLNLKPLKLSYKSQ